MQATSDPELSVASLGEATSRLIEDHVDLADRIARRMAPPSVSFEDFVQAARLALVQAALRYDATRRVPFAGYASIVIAGRLKHHLRDACWDVRVPRTLQETWLRAGKAREGLAQRLGRSPTMAELAAEVGVDEEHLLAAIPVGDAWSVTHFESACTEDGGAWEPADAHDHYTCADERLWLHGAVASLPQRLRDIVRMYYVEDIPQREIAARIGVSQMQVSRLLARAVALLRTAAG